MMEETTPPVLEIEAEEKLLDRTRDALADAREAVTEAVNSAIETAKKHPAATAAVAAGAAVERCATTWSMRSAKAGSIARQKWCGAT